MQDWRRQLDGWLAIVLSYLRECFFLDLALRAFLDILSTLLRFWVNEFFQVLVLPGSFQPCLP